MAIDDSLERARLHPDVLKNLNKNKKLKAAEAYSEDNPPPYPVTSVNGETGDVSIDTGVTSIRADYPGGGVGENTGDVSLVGSGCLVHTLYPGRVEVQASKNTIGLGSVANERQYSANNPPPYPVTSVNSKTGAVTLGKSDIGLGNVDNVKQYSSSNPPPYPVTSVNGQTGDVSVPKAVYATLSCELVSTASGARNAWPIGANSPPLGDNLTLTARNASTGAVHVIWYYSTDRTFEVAATLIGNAPNAGDIVFVTYLA